MRFFEAVDSEFVRERMELLEKFATWLTPLFGPVDINQLKSTIDKFWGWTNDPLKTALERLRSVDVQKYAHLVNDRCNLLNTLGDRACPVRMGFIGLFSKDPVADAERMLQYANQEQDKIKSDVAMRRKSERQQAEKDKLSLHTKEGTYERVDFSAYRIVCSDDDPGFDKTGMPMFKGDHAGKDPELDGYMAVHVTGDPDGWLPILMRDGYCDANYAFVYNLKLDEISRNPFYKLEDYHITDRTDTPDSYIVISKRKKIPARYVELVEKIDTAEIEEAPPLH